MKKVILLILSTFLQALALQIPSTATLAQNTNSTQSLQAHRDQIESQQLGFIESPTKRLEQSSNVTWCVGNLNGDQYLCPKTSVCTSDYNFCPYVSTTCNSLSPFKCANGTCVSNPALQCCPPVKGVTQVWCPHLNSCVNATNATTACCSLNSSTPFYCRATKSCVSQSYQCCSQSSLVKCSSENKCVPTNSREYCFQPFNRSCSGEFSYQCPNDGTCKRSAADCSSPRVCPFGYTTCPDYSCLPGINSIASCPKLSTCIIKGVTLARCSDGVTCTESFDKCPTQVTCATGEVVCPDNTCATNQMKCVQPLVLALPPKVSTCGLNQVRCPDGECSLDCNNLQARHNCSQLGLIQCPKTFQCAASYDSCPSEIYCPIARNYTYSSNAVICSEGPNICTWDASQCKRKSCFNPLYYFNLIGASALPWQNYNTLDLMSCPDGRCNPTDSNCLTEISCSGTFIKGQSSGVYCHNSTAEADTVAELAFQLQTLTCPSNMIQCLSGHCRASVYDCPQTISCPSSSPIQCQDGQCVSNKQSCQATDILVSRNIKTCLDQKMLLCQSDLKTCVTSLEQCPTMSTCPMGYSKCAENLCLLKSQCSSQSSLCSSSTPFYCRSSGTCVKNQTLCLSLTTCPLSKPVKCASDQSCQFKVSQCPPFGNSVPIVPTIENGPISNITSGSTCLHYTCQDGSCKTMCTEWLNCPLASDYQCSNGLCVTNSTQCANSTNGCPFYAPYKCNFTASCVSNTSQCPSQTTSNTTLTSTCKTLFGTLTKSCLSGGCVSVNETCPNTTEICNSYLFPNTVNSSQCFVPQCPPSLPIKCENGLCVSQKKFCPVIPFTAPQLNKCKSLSNLTGQNIPVPCGDGSCVARVDLCPPLYNCSLNANLSNPNNLTVRCNDGTCRDSLKQCPVLNQTCTFRCSNGMCVSSASQCLLDNGCTAATPNRCEQNGVCMSAGQSCKSIYQVNQALSINSSTTSSICYSKLQVTCISAGLQYCAPNRANCINVDTGCNVFTPILCGGKCVQSMNKCATGQTPALNNQGCGPSTPFRCSNLDIASCAALPYSSNSSLAQNVCSAKTQNLVDVQPINRCTNALTPVSCGDGSCVQNQGECRTCNFFCTSMMQCTASASECTAFTQGKSTTFRSLDQQCPEGVPIRCILNGQCVSSIAQCQDPQTSIAKTFRSNLIDVTCPTNSPFRCITGQCVNSTAFCLSQSMMNTSQMMRPIQWNATRSQVNSLCQVYCADGSCRDRQQNCPLAQACLSPEAPFRCRQGVCAQNRSECSLLFGVSELESSTGVSAYCYSIFGFNQSQQYFRCEDGTCRPALFNNITNSYTSSCLQYFGCPLTQPYQCSTGQCVQSQSDCLSYSHSFCKGKQMCKNLACVNYLQECTIDQSQFSIIPFTADVNPLQDNEIPFLVSNLVSNNPVVGTISIPSNAISGTQQSISLSQSNYQRVVIQPVLGQRDMNSSVLQSSIAYTSNLFKVTDATISLVDSLLFPLFEMSLLDSNQSAFTFNATLTASITLPTYFDLASDVCLAKKNLNDSMDCVSRNLTQQSAQSISVPIQGPGVYGLIFSPDISLKGSNPPLPFPTPSDNSGADECNWYCQHKKLIMIIYICSGVVILLCIIAALIFCCCRKWRQSKLAQNAVYQESLVEKQPKQIQKTVNSEKTERITTLQTEEQVTQKLTLNDSNSDEEQRKREKLNEERMRKKIESKLKMQAEEELRKERELFNKALEVKEQEIKNLKSAIKETEPIDKSSSPESRQVYSSAHYKEELKKRESQMREHFQEEVNRISRELLRQQEQAKNAPPRKFIRPGKDSSVKSFTSGSNYGSLPTQNSAPQLDNKNKKIRSDNELDEQWNVMMDEYSSTKGLQTQQNEKVSKPRSRQDNQNLIGSKKEGQTNPKNTQIEAEGYTRRGKTNDQNFKSPSRRLY